MKLLRVPDGRSLLQLCQVRCQSQERLFTRGGSNQVHSLKYCTHYISMESIEHFTPLLYVNELVNLHTKIFIVTALDLGAAEQALHTISPSYKICIIISIMMNLKPVFFALFLSPPTTRGTICFFSCHILNCVHKPIVCLVLASSAQ